MDKFCFLLTVEEERKEVEDGLADMDKVCLDAELVRMDVCLFHMDVVVCEKGVGQNVHQICMVACLEDC